MGLGGFQEVNQLPIFQPITKYQAHVNNPARIAEFTGRAFDYAMLERGPVQINIPRDFFYHETNYTIPQPAVIQRSAGSPASLDAAVKLLQTAKVSILCERECAVAVHRAVMCADTPVYFCGPYDVQNPVILAGGGVVMSGAGVELKALAEHLQVPVATTYLHNDAFSKSHPLYCGPLGKLLDVYGYSTCRLVVPLIYVPLRSGFRYSL